MAGKVLVGLASMAGGYLADKAIKSLKDNGYKVPEIIERLAPNAGAIVGSATVAEAMQHHQHHNEPKRHNGGSNR